MMNDERQSNAGRPELRADKSEILKAQKSAAHHERPRILVLAETGWDDGTWSPEEAVCVDDWLGQQKIELTLRLDPGGLISGAATLHFSAVQDFSPDGVIDQVPQLARLAEARQRLDACRRGKAEPAQVAEDLELAGQFSDRTSSAPPLTHRANGTPSRLDELLEGVDLSAEGSEPSAAQLGASQEERLADSLSEAAASLGSEPGAATERRRVEEAIEILDTILGREVRRFIENPKWREIERTWRGLAFLERWARRAGFELELLSASRENFLEVFGQEDFEAEHSRERDQPLAMVLCAFAFGRSTDDLDRLETAARFAESLSAPFVADLDIGFWGIERPALLAGLPDLGRRLAGPEYSKWRALAAEERSSWLFLTVNRFLPRQTWGSESSGRIRRYQDRGEACRPLWVGTSWLLAAAVCRAQEQARVRFFLPDAEIGDLPLEMQTPRRGAAFPYPMEVYLPSSRIEEMARLGLVAPKADKGAPMAWFVDAPSWRRPEVYDVDAATRAGERAASLSQRVFAALATWRLDSLTHSGSVLDSQEQWQARLIELMADLVDPKESMEEQIHAELEDGALFLRLQPKWSVGSGPLDLVLSVPMGG